MKGRNVFLLSGIALALPFFAACSINKMAMRSSNPEFIGAHIPGVLEKNEKKLARNPGDQTLILDTGSLFVMYANAFVQGPAELLPRDKYAERQAALERAKKLYLRGADILYGGLEKKYPGFSGGSRSQGFPEIVARMEKADVPYLYWAAAGYLSAYSLNPFDMELGVKIPELMSLVNRAYELDPDFNSGALDDFLVLAYASLPESMGGNKALVDTHYQRSLEKSGGRLAGPYVSYATAVSIPVQDYDTFKECLEKALEIDPDADPGNRLVNIISQRKARYLLDNAGLYFIDFDTGGWDEEDY
jgi:predicted anti-sigma-YlaC factor YlaD